MLFAQVRRRRMVHLWCTKSQTNVEINDIENQKPQRVRATFCCRDYQLMLHALTEKYNTFEKLCDHSSESF